MPLNPRKPETTVEWIHVRAVIRYLRLKGLSQADAVKELRNVCGFDVSKAFVSKVWLSSPGEGPNQGVGGGRPTSTSPRTTRLIRKSTGNANRSLKQIKEVVPTRLGKTVSKSTVRRVLKREGFSSFVRQKASRLTEKHKEQRLEFARRWVGEASSFWEDVVFTDEKMWECHEATMNRQNSRIWAKNVESVPVLETDGYPDKIHCWGGMAACGTLPLQWIEGGLDGAGYVAILEKAKPQIDRLFPSNTPWVFEDDNASAHTSKVATVWKTENFERRFLVGRSAKVREDPMFHPAKLDDLWPIERLWGITSNLVFATQQLPKKGDRQSWQRLVEECWNRIPRRTLTRLVHGIPAKLAEIVRLQGGRIRADWSPSGRPGACTCQTCTSTDSEESSGDESSIASSSLSSSDEDSLFWDQ